MRPHHGSLAAMALLAPLALSATPLGRGGCPPQTPQAATATDATVTSFDGTPIAITLMRPAGTCAARPAPVVLTLHGWSGSREKTVTAPDASRLLAAGYGVVSIDARGHGESGGKALLHHPAREVRDFRRVLDWVHDNVDWVARQRASGIDKDLVAGAYGASYGGAFQLQTAAYDPRLDALVPAATWHHLPHSLAPYGALKSDWIGLLYAAGKAAANIDPRIDRWVVEGMATNRMPPDAVRSLTASSPSSRLGHIRAPTLLIQGLPDTLFNLNEAVRTFRGLVGNGVDARLVGVNTGHVLPGVQPTGLAAPERGATNVCTDVEALVVDFLDAHLRGDRDARRRLAATPRVMLPTEQGGCVTAEGWPAHDHVRRVGVPALAVPQPAGSYLVPLLTAEEEMTVAGIPRLRATLPVETGDIVYLSLVLKTGESLHVVDDQVVGARTAGFGVGGAFHVELGGVATSLRRGDRLYLRVGGANEQYAANSNRRPGAAVLRDVVVSLPVVDGHRR